MRPRRFLGATVGQLLRMPLFRPAIGLALLATVIPLPAQAQPARPLAESSDRQAETVSPASTTLPYHTYSGYFVSNQFDPDAAESYLVITDQKQFDKVFGVAMVMGDKSHRLPKDLFQSNVVLAVIKRGHAVCDFKVENITVNRGLVELRYRVASQNSDSATFACPMIVSIATGSYKSVQFIENRKLVKTVALKHK